MTSKKKKNQTGARAKDMRHKRRQKHNSSIGSNDTEACFLTARSLKSRLNQQVQQNNKRNERDKDR